MIGINNKESDNMLNLNKIDLAGRQFGLLKVKRIYQIKDGNVWWKCECICGSIVAVKANDLRVVNDCGCLSDYKQEIITIKKSEGMYVALHDIDADGVYGAGVGTLQPVKPNEIAKTNINSKVTDKVGDSTKKQAPEKQTSKSKVTNVDDMIGKKFGRLTVLNYVGLRGALRAYRCRCDCGKEVVVTGTNLRTGKRTMCHGSNCELNNKNK